MNTFSASEWLQLLALNPEYQDTDHPGLYVPFSVVMDRVCKLGEFQSVSLDGDNIIVAFTKSRRLRHASAKYGNGHIYYRTFILPGLSGKYIRFDLVARDVERILAKVHEFMPKDNEVSESVS